MPFTALLTALLLARPAQATDPAAGERDDVYLVQRSASVPADAAESRGVALCVTGMLARAQPEHAINNFVKASPGFHFDVIYVFEDNRKLRFSTMNNVRFNPTGFWNLTQHGAKKALKKIYRGVDNAYIHVLPFVRKKSAASWAGFFGLAPGQRLDRIEQYNDTQKDVLDMYNKQRLCASYVLKLEEKRGQKFHTVVSTREDVYLFKPMPLNGLLANHEGCDYIGKDCQTHMGLNMRMQVLSRRSLDFIHKRLDFYRGLYSSPVRSWNPEMFELRQAASLGMKVCRASVNEFPATAARHTSEGQFCFIPPEVEDCVPDGYGKFVGERLCTGA